MDQCLALTKALVRCKKSTSSDGYFCSLHAGWRQPNHSMSKLRAEDLPYLAKDFDLSVLSRETLVRLMRSLGVIFDNRDSSRSLVSRFEDWLSNNRLNIVNQCFGDPEAQIQHNYSLKNLAVPADLESFSDEQTAASPTDMSDAKQYWSPPEKFERVSPQTYEQVALDPGERDTYEHEENGSGKQQWSRHISSPALPIDECSTPPTPDLWAFTPSRQHTGQLRENSAQAGNFGRYQRLPQTYQRSVAYNQDDATSAASADSSKVPGTEQPTASSVRKRKHLAPGEERLFKASPAMGDSASREVLPEPVRSYGRDILYGSNHRNQEKSMVADDGHHKNPLTRESSAIASNIAGARADLKPEAAQKERRVELIDGMLEEEIEKA